MITAFYMTTIPLEGCDIDFSAMTIDITEVPFGMTTVLLTTTICNN